MIVVNGLITLGLVGSYAYFFLAIVITLGLSYLSWRFVENLACFSKRNLLVLRRNLDPKLERV